MSRSSTSRILFLCQKLLVSHPYKNLMTFGGCKQDFMLVVGTSASKDKPMEKHLFAMDASKVSEGRLQLYLSFGIW